MKIQAAKLLEGTELRFVEDDAAEEAVVDCAGCHAPCCRSQHLDAIPLSLHEAEKLPHTFGTAKFPNGTVVENVALLVRHPVTGDCAFVTQDGKCSIWSMRPKACRVYDCRVDSHPKMRTFARERFGGVFP